ncbi:hypothetical protein QBC38DRAFT_463253 [Podospora fimiseda]|uniref:Uncharacterized protein n=1 Tax=Podospora fimiseda TaxID=252190 RepID=A0AAN7H2Q2_9PEZI|nr:hypothetical protein QBC38DRAFT_463253 [Podospora fimiseda]
MIPIRSKSPPSTSQQAVLTAPQSRIVPKPTPQQQIQDARGYQLNQLRRRFSPEEKELGDGGETSLLFKLHPSDPDFPFDLDYLDCDLRIPKGYPDQNEMPRLLVKNKNIPRGFAINIEQGWDKLVEERDKQKLNLLGLVNSLDRRLEGLLMEEKKETVKVVIFKDKRHEEEKGKGVDQEKKEKPMQQQQQQQRRPYIPEESFTKEEIAEAKARRAQEVRQLEARMGRLQNYQKSSDGVVYTVPLEPKRKGMLPRGLQQVKSVQLIVPLLYPLQPLRVLLNDVESSEEDAEGLEELFTKKAMTEQKQMSLMSHLNYLAQNMHLLVKQVQKNAVSAAAKTPAVEVVSEKTDVEAKEAEHSSTLETGRGGHVHVIPRPPEWGQMDGSDSSGSSDYDDEDEEEGGAVLGTEPAEETPLPTQTVEKGTAMSFPSFELHGIELLQVSILALSVKCERCKTLNDITGLKNNLEKSSSCKKCATAFTVRFRQELVHMNSTRAGFIDVSGCTVADMLPRFVFPLLSRNITNIIYPAPSSQPAINAPTQP